ncbi:hypothetical protein SYNPS1DRAFT_22121 [Syncephalis pseudoplumigaleata]|uniref:BAR domain-containing protein n=1 Tax=Syncephalis pseudoplumigaleata TaxID=1712513 RepID=A0A4V1J1S0_9FUNG|nr:hypothetical protein SYNPS1DRAFT_22121 [Syncephalis pseudoplumigaleata]|eukprot:RKP26029.1 hypothetical protein SYNPS1DRAFT_22121 [Syncephalis pseudoplumigaleata]
MNFNQFVNKLNPLAQQMSRGLNQAVQWTEERLGNVEHLTDLPQDYKDLERRVDAIRAAHLSMLRVTRAYAQPSFKEPLEFQETVRSMATRVQSLAMGPDVTAAEEAAEDEPKNAHQAMARACNQSSDQIGLEEPFGAALFKYATVSEKIGDSELKMATSALTVPIIQCKEITDKFFQPFQVTLHSSIQNAMDARKRVQAARLRLDGCKTRYKSATPDREPQLREEVEKAEDEFVTVVEEATSVMRALIESPEPLRNLADLVAAQLAHFKDTYELLQDLAPEIDEMQVTQEALYRSGRSQD